MSNKQVIGFDADDTLWENEVFFHQAQMTFIELHPHIKDPEEVILQIEKENIKFYGYGIKGFILSLLEASVRFSNNQPDFQNIDKIIKIGKDMLEDTELTEQEKKHIMQRFPNMDFESGLSGNNPFHSCVL